MQMIESLIEIESEENIVFIAEGLEKRRLLRVILEDDCM